MRIIGGKYKGHHLVAFKADHIRPTTDRVKETLFNKIQFDIEDSRFVDLFSGTGSLGLEALSRGAAFVTFVESSAQSLSILNENIKKLKVDSSLYKIVKMDVIAFIKKFEGEAPDIILCDPPFTKKMAEEVLVAASTSKLLSETTQFITEAGQEEKLKAEYGDLKKIWEKSYGDKVLAMYSKGNFDV